MDEDRDCLVSLVCMQTSPGALITLDFMSLVETRPSPALALPECMEGLGRWTGGEFPWAHSTQAGPDGVISESFPLLNHKGLIIYHVSSEIPLS